MNFAFKVLRLISRHCLPFLLASTIGWGANNTLIFCAENPPEGLDPSLWDTSSTFNVTNQIMQGLLAFKPGGTELIPDLANRWEVSADGLNYTFHLRPNVWFQKTAYFTPTRPFNADDVLFTFQRMLDKDHPFNQAFPALFTFSDDIKLAGMIAALEKINSHTVRIRLHKPNVPFLSLFAMGFSRIHSAEYAGRLLAEKRAADINRFPVGTGPYLFSSAEPDVAIRLQANPRYWGKPQQTGKLVISFVRDPMVRIQMLKKGDCQIAAALRDSDLAQVAAEPKLKILSTGAMNISYLGFHMKKPPTDKLLVRQALDMAVDRNAIFRAIFSQGGATQATSAFPPNVWAYHDGLKNEYSPEKARQLLAQAGYPQGFDIELWALPVQRPTNPNARQMAEMIQQDWKKIGVTTRINTFEFGTYLKKIREGEHQVYMLGWTGDSGDPDDFLTPTLSCASSHGGINYCNPEFDQLIDSARGMLNPAKRKALYLRAQEIFKQDRPWITMAHSKIYIPMQKSVEGFVMRPNGGFFFDGVYLAQHK